MKLDLIDARFRFVEEIAVGGMGRVVLTRDETTGRRVAVKYVLPHLRGTEVDRRFEREIRVARLVRSGHVARAIAVGRDPEVGRYLAMEYVDGPTVHARCAREGKLDHAASLKLGSQLLQALRDIRRAGVVHRDLKPANVMLGERARVIDFGICRFLGEIDTGAEPPITAPGRPVGTLRMMAPERLVSAKETSTATDVYGWGMVMFVACCAHRPFGKARTAEQLVRAVLAGGHPGPHRIDHEVDARLGRLVERCLSATPTMRPSLMEIGAALDEIHRHDSVFRAPAPAVPRTTKRPTHLPPEDRTERSAPPAMPTSRSLGGLPARAIEAAVAGASAKRRAITPPPAPAPAPAPTRQPSRCSAPPAPATRAKSKASVAPPPPRVSMPSPAPRVSPRVKSVPPPAPRAKSVPPPAPRAKSVAPRAKSVPPPAPRAKSSVPPPAPRAKSSVPPAPRAKSKVSVPPPAPAARSKISVPPPPPSIRSKAPSVRPPASPLPPKSAPAAASSPAPVAPRTQLPSREPTLPGLGRATPVAPPRMRGEPTERLFRRATTTSLAIAALSDERHLAIAAAAFLGVMGGAIAMLALAF